MVRYFSGQQEHPLRKVGITVAVIMTNVIIVIAIGIFQTHATILCFLSTYFPILRL